MTHQPEKPFTEKGNEIIARFMEISDFKMNEYKCFQVRHNNHLTGWYNWKTLEYHSSWDWIMPVVAKIEAIHHVYEHDYINVHITQGYVKIDGTRTNIFRNTSGEGSKIKAVYLAVIDFIEWYNEIKK